MRGLKLRRNIIPADYPRRTPPGVRGLKLGVERGATAFQKSHPARGAWIETNTLLLGICVKPSRTPPGVRGLKPIGHANEKPLQGRTPPGVRGLKHLFGHLDASVSPVAPRPGCVD